MTKGPTLEFLGGVAEIGGNKIVVEEGGDRILFDFGPSFSGRKAQFYYNFLQPRSTSPVKDLLEFDLIPRVEGLYREEALAGADLPYTAPRFGGVFVSHAHFDHAGYLEHIDPKIPVFVGPGTRQLLEAIEASTQTRYGEHDYRIAPDHQAVRVGSLEVVPIPVDHSIPWASGFIVRAPNGTLVYTGDFRRHGPRAALTDAFVAAAAAERPDALLIEGTRAGPDPRRNLSEAGVRSSVDRLLERTPDLAIASAYPRDLDRLTTLHRAAVGAGRDLVVSLRTAHLLETLAGVAGGPEELPIPGRTAGLKVYARPKKVYKKWERALLDDAVDAEWVRRHGPAALLSLDLMNFPELIDLRPPRHSPYIHSMSEPFSEDDVDDAVLKNWLAHFELTYHQMHASGHCSMSELEDVIRSIGPRTVYPIHTEHPEAFTSTASRVVAPALATPYAFRPSAPGVDLIDPLGRRRPMPPDRLAFGVPALDALLGGGLDPDAVTEVFGEGGSGKSVLCLHLTSRVALSGRWVLYVDTEGVSLERLEASAGPRLHEALQHLLLARARSLGEQDEAVAKAAVLARDPRHPVGLVVVDSLAFFYRLAAAGEDADEGRESLLAELAALVAVTSEMQVPAIFTNQVWRNLRDGTLEPLGGSFVNHAAKTILRMDRLEDDRRRVVLVKHRSRPPGAAPIRITSQGLEPA